MHDASSQTLGVDFVEFSRRKLLDEYWPRMRRCIESLSDDQIWWRPNEASNSIGNLVLHLNGNVRQWLVASFTHTEDARNRPAEFSERTHVPTRTLIDALDATMGEASRVLGRLTDGDLLTTFDIQGYTVSGLDAVYQVVEHFALHYGQVVYITKQLRGEDLDFYPELRATGRIDD